MAFSLSTDPPKGQAYQMSNGIFKGGFDVSSQETSPASDDSNVEAGTIADAHKAEIQRDLLEGDDLSMDATKSTYVDVRDMQRMGHKQQLVRNFKLLSTISFVNIATGNWILLVFTIGQGLIDGGRAGLIWSLVWNFIGFWPIVASMAEMASMSPIAGAQYHWVSEFAPARYQKVMSYFTGYFSTLAWQAGNAQGVFLTGILIQTLISLNDAAYSFPNWQGTLLAIATTVLVFLVNFFGNQWIPRMQNVTFVLWISLYLCLIVPVGVLAPHTSAKALFTEFANSGGWSNMSLAILVGQLSGINAMTGIDTAAHIAEEIEDASRNVPIAMMVTYYMNFALALPATIILCWAMPDLNAALNDPSTYPVIYVLRQTMSPGWITAFIAGVVVLLFISNISYLTAVSRDLFAFARDSGVPFPKWIAHVSRKRHIPTNALIVSCIIACLLSLIYLGSSTAYYAIVSLFVVSIVQCYMFSIGSILYRRIAAPETLPPARWSLGSWGIPCNVAALVYVVWSFFWSFWPQFYRPDASEFNWAVVLFVLVGILSGIFYLFRGRHVYKGPVLLVEGRGLGLK